MGSTPGLQKKDAQLCVYLRVYVFDPVQNSCILNASPAMGGHKTKTGKQLSQKKTKENVNKKN